MALSCCLPQDEAAWTFDHPIVQKELARLVARMERDPSARQDFMQEATSHFWMKTVQRPGQSLDWYLKSCKYHLQHYRVAGCSVDALKHHGAQVTFAEAYEEHVSQIDTSKLGAGVMSEVISRDMMAVLSPRLESLDRSILRLMNEGLGMHEIANLLHISHQFANRRRCKIAAIAIALGIFPPSKS
jgi:DNA-directed RNA polymerase specialized sigma24 family protein